MDKKTKLVNVAQEHDVSDELLTIKFKNDRICKYNKQIVKEKSE